MLFVSEWWVLWVMGQAIKLNILSYYISLPSLFLSVSLICLGEIQQ